MLTGDINIDLIEQKCVHNLLHIPCIHGMKNIVKEATCYKSGSSSSIGVALSNVPNRLQGVSYIDTELSDFHKMIVFATKITIPLKKKEGALSKLISVMGKPTI